MCPVVRMQLLGGFFLEYQNKPLSVPSQRLQTLLAYLACNSSAPQPRQRLAFLLWPDSSETQAHTNLRTLLHRLRTTLPEFEAVLSVDAQTVAWNSDMTLTLDVVDFETEMQCAIAAQDTGDSEDEQACLLQVAALYSGDFLPDCYDDWVHEQREHLRHQFFAALERLAALLEQRRAYSEAITYARRLTQLDPLNEITCLTLMRLYIANGERASALRAYHACASSLHAELGTTPGPALRALHEQILSSQTPAAARVSEQLVGRIREWQWVRAAWEIAAAGHARLLVITGEAGIGKSRLAEELVRWAARQGIFTAVAHCHASEGELTYAPIISWLRTETLRPHLKRLPATELCEVARLVPEVATPHTPPPGPLTESWQRQRLYEALGLGVLSAERPTMLLLDDLQWCTRDTLEWLHFLMRMDRRLPLLIVGTVRMEEVDEAHALTMLLEALRYEDRITEVALGGLSRSETEELATLLMKGTVSEEQVHYLYDETEGNPLFIVEMIRAGLTTLPYQEAGQTAERVSASGNLSLPPVVKAVIARRLGQVTAPTRALLDLASVIGHSFTFPVLARAADVDEDTLLQGLDELWQRHIVREHGPEAYDFTHDKLRAVAYDNLSAARRRVLHRRVAEAFEEDTDTQVDAASGHIAMHYEGANMPTQAAHYYQRAALLARRLYANETALAFCESVRRLLGDEFPEEEAIIDDQMADLLHLMSRYDEARELWQRALALTPASQHVARAQLYRKIGNAWRDQYGYDEAQRAYAAADDALSAGPIDSESRTALIQIVCERITTLYWLGRADEMDALINRVRPILESDGSISQLARLHQLSALTLLRQLRYGASWEAVEHARTYLRLIQEAGDTAALPAAHFQLGFTLLWANELDAAEEECSAALQLAERSSDLSLQARSLTYLTVIARRRAAVDDVQRLAARSLQVATDGQMPDYVGAAHGNLAWVSWRTGNIADAEMYAQMALDAWQPLPAGYMFEWIGRWPLIGIYLRHDNVSGAAEQAQALLDHHQQRPPPDLESALEAAVQAASSRDHATVKRLLGSVTGMATEHGYL